MIAVDLGQSGARIKFNGEEYISHRAKLAGENPVDSLRAVFSEIPKLQSDMVTLSLTGFNGIVLNVDKYGELCKEFFGAKEVVVIDDGLAGFIGALGGKAGVTLLIGGGVVSVGGKNGKFSHKDGLGSIFGDEGSGYWLGKHGLTRALATEEDRDSHFELQEIMSSEILAFHNLVSKNGTDGAELAIKAAKKLLEAADLGISVAIQIRNLGAELLAKTVASTWRGVSGEPDESLDLVISGGLSKNSNYKNKIQEEVQKLLKNVNFAEPNGDNLAGAIWIANNMKDDAPPMMRWARSAN